MKLRDVDGELLRIVEERLERSGRADDAWAGLVLAACEEQQSVDARFTDSSRQAPLKRGAHETLRGAAHSPGTYDAVGASTNMMASPRASACAFLHMVHVHSSSPA